MNRRGEHHPGPTGQDLRQTMGWQGCGFIHHHQFRLRRLGQQLIRRQKAQTSTLRQHQNCFGAIGTETVTCRQAGMVEHSIHRFRAGSSDHHMPSPLFQQADGGNPQCCRLAPATICRYHQRTPAMALTSANNGIDGLLLIRGLGYLKRRHRITKLG